MKTLIISVLALFLAGCALVLTLSTAQHPLGNVITNAVPQFSSAATVAVGPQQVITLASRASNCTSRIISTASTTLMLSFGTLVPSGTVGHWQGASTTVSYDNAQYGCGAITAYSPASSTVAVTIFTQ